MVKIQYNRSVQSGRESFNEESDHISYNLKFKPLKGNYYVLRNL